MKGIVLCAGLGTRLRPITDVWPKPAVPLLGGPLVRYAFAVLRRAGITSLGINTHHLPQVMEAIARAEARGPLEVSHEAEQLLGTGGALRGLRPFLRDDHFVVMNGDVLFGLELAPIIAAHRSSGAAATMVLLPMPEGEKYNAVELDQGGVVRRIANRGAPRDRLTPWHFTGVHVMSPQVFDFLTPSGADDIIRVYLAMTEAGLQVRGHVVQERVYWSDLGTPERYLKTVHDLLFGQVPLQVFGENGPLGAAVKHPTLNAWVHPTAQLDDDVKLAGPAYVGAGARLDAGVRLGSAVAIGQNAAVTRGVRLNRVAVLDGVTAQHDAADRIISS